MPSPLYANAVGALGSAEPSWQQRANVIASIPEQGNCCGKETLQNIQDEEQLSSDPGNADPQFMVALLRDLCTIAYEAGDGAAFGQAYERTVEPHRLKGSSIKTHPPHVYRYINGPGLFRGIVKALTGAGRGALAEALQKRVDEARAARTTWDTVFEFVQDPVTWGALPRDQVALSGGPSTFVTFDTTPAPQRTSATALHRALALPKPRHACFMEIRYVPGPGDVLRYPTVADAGWFRYFRPASVAEPHGWTRPHPGDTLGRQPEAVQETPTLDGVKSAVKSADDMRLLAP